MAKEEAKAKVQRYLVTADNPDYADVTAGVQFNRGQALIDPLTLDANLGRTPAEVADLLREMGGYAVREVE
ncbi:MAG: hypothetical protein IPK44_01585 [Candidatus Accumulibacter sp.]|uniref:hypothetical protein n=1 Tax=Accumulibacter sp. TaxID=2053492 RepID=UPI002591151F|nr:hypothetical protein [Accumulibacter sp.]MBK8113292.1 hypothetical protein [Accumulibacter sp.]